METKEPAIIQEKETKPSLVPPILAMVISVVIPGLGQVLAREVRRVRKSGFTIAPEAGSERLRKALSKKLSDEDILRAVKILSRQRIQNIKLYFIIGLPSETDDDIKSIIKMTKEIKHVYFKEAKGEKWLNHITLSISPFVPKPFTPFQWHPFEQVSILKQKLKIISSGLRKEKKFRLITIFQSGDMYRPC